MPTTYLKNRKLKIQFEISIFNQEGGPSFGKHTAKQHDMTWPRFGVKSTTVMFFS